MKAVSLFTTSLLLIAATADADEHTERLDYKVKVLNAEFAKAALYSSSGKVYGEIKTSEKWSSIFPMDNKIASRIDDRNFPTETELQFCKRKKKSIYEIAFGDRRIKVIKNVNGRSTTKVRRIHRKTHDLTSWIYEMRERVKLAPNESTSFKVFSGNKTYDVNLVPHPREEINTPLGTKVTIPYTITVTRPLKYKRELKMWFDIEDFHTPIRATGASRIGTFEVMIESIKRKGVTTNETINPDEKQIN